MHEEDPVAGGSAARASHPTPVHLRVAAVADQVAAVRRAVLESAKAHGIGAAPREDIALAVSEACTNVVMHAYRGAAAPGPLAVDAYRDNAEFFVVVCDEGTGLSPHTDTPASASASGSGASASASGSAPSAAWRCGWRSRATTPSAPRSP
jgi:serine/threonine-protein kinase RsbW